MWRESQRVRVHISSVLSATTSYKLTNIINTHKMLTILGILLHLLVVDLVLSRLLNWVWLRLRYLLLNSSMFPLKANFSHLYVHFYFTSQLSKSSGGGRGTKRVIDRSTIFPREKRKRRCASSPRIRVSFFNFFFNIFCQWNISRKTWRDGPGHCIVFSKGDEVSFVRKQPAAWISLTLNHLHNMQHRPGRESLSDSLLSFVCKKQKN